MNTRIVKFFISVSLFAMLATMGANAQDLKLRASIPFDFVYGDVTMPAGDYDLMKLNTMSGNGVFQVRDENGKNTAMRPVMARVPRSKAPTESVFIFNRYRENGGEVSHFLSQVWVAGDNAGFAFFKHRSEREAAKRAASRDIITIVVKRATSATE